MGKYKCQRFKKILTHLGLYLVRSKTPPPGRHRKSYDWIAYTVKPVFDECVHEAP
jgi:hypothetical protein